jgi:hypothetical protein
MHRETNFLQHAVDGCIAHFTVDTFEPHICSHALVPQTRRPTYLARSCRNCGAGHSSSDCAASRTNNCLVRSRCWHETSKATITRRARTPHAGTASSGVCGAQARQVARVTRVLCRAPTNLWFLAAAGQRHACAACWPSVCLRNPQLAGTAPSPTTTCLLQEAADRGLAVTDTSELQRKYGRRF